MVAAPPLLSAQQPTRLTPEDILGIRQIDGDIQLSSDGKQIGFTLTEPVDLVHPDTPPRADIWIVPADGSAPPQRFPASGGSDESPRWSPDARSLAFLSRRRS